jgi:cytochrome oxidase assembly protein ShyY1
MCKAREGFLERAWGSPHAHALPAADIDQFESDYSFKKVKLRGIFDHSKEIQVEKLRNGEKGVEIITPFYTHLNELGEECGILINRGWVP